MWTCVISRNGVNQSLLIHAYTNKLVRCRNRSMITKTHYKSLRPAVRVLTRKIERSIDRLMSAAKIVKTLQNEISDLKRNLTPFWEERLISRDFRIFIVTSWIGFKLLLALRSSFCYILSIFDSYLNRSFNRPRYPIITRTTGCQR